MTETVDFRLEQSLPELQDLVHQELFTHDEVRSVLKIRSKHEHTLLNRNARISDYLSYIKYEMALESLRQKRLKRKKNATRKTISSYAGPKRIRSIFQRATLRFQDRNLWLQYIEYSKSENSSKLTSQIFGEALQKFPSSPDLWIEAARFEYERNFNITGARNLLLRSLRLNPERRELWLEYARLETLYIFKILERRRVLGLDDKSRMEEKAWDDKDFDGQNEITLPTITADDLETDGSKTESVLNPRLADVSKNAALNGAIPTMVYSSATSACPNDILLLVGFYEMFLSFHPIVPFINSILDTIKHDMGEKFPGRGYTLLVQIKDCIRGVRADDEKFPAAVREMMNMAHAIPTMSLENRKECCTGLLTFIQGLSEIPDLEENIGEVLKIFQRRVMKWV